MNFGNLSSLTGVPGAQSGTPELYASKISSAYSASWQYRQLSGVYSSFDSNLSDDTLTDFSVSLTTNSVLLTCDVGATGVFVIVGGDIPVRGGQGIRVNISGEFTPSPLTTGAVTITIVGSVSGVVATGTLVQDGTVSLSAVSTVDESLHIEMAGGVGKPSGAWTNGEEVSLTVVTESFPPVFQDVVFSLNPAIPSHRIVLGIPDGSFSCVAHLSFENSSAAISNLDIALGIVPGRFFITPPTKALQAQIFSSAYAGGQPLFISDGKIIDNEDASTVSLNVACFEWTAIADRLRISFDTFTPAPGGLFAGIMQMPTS